MAITERIKISELPAALAINDDDVFPVMEPDAIDPDTGQPGVTSGATAAQLAEYLGSNDDIVDMVDAKVGAEASTRESADTLLQTALNTEKTARESADTTISTGLASEVTRATGKENEINTSLSNHVSDTTNPHAVTAAQVGLGNVDNTADEDKPVSTAQATAIDDAVAAAKLATQKWLPAVEAVEDLPTTVPTDDINYLCRVRSGTDAGVYQWIAGETEWDYFSDNLDFVDETELATSLSDYYDKDEVDDYLGGKVDKVTGKELSTNDYTDDDKAIVDGVETELTAKLDKQQATADVGKVIVVGSDGLLSLVTPPGYSTDEVNTGKTWIDGKPVYRRAFTGNIVAAANTNTETTLMYYGVDTLVDCGGQIQLDNNFWQIGCTYVNNNVTLFSFIAHASNSNNIYIQSKSSNERTGTTNNAYKVWVEYTKL